MTFSASARFAPEIRLESRCYPKHSLERHGHLPHRRHGAILALGTIPSPNSYEERL